MKYLIVSGNPKSDGLCYSVTEQLIRGAKDGGAETDVLIVEKPARCHVCGDGWGTCREKHSCAFGGDGFNDAQERIRNSDQFCFITPVYWGEMAEALKGFFDRLRRCEFGQSGALSGKQILLVASPGGTGNGMLTCLEQMDRFCRHTGAVIFDYIGINRGAWIETLRSGYDAGARWSHLARVRGLKRLLRYPYGETPIVAPRTGAWIETI